MPRQILKQLKALQLGDLVRVEWTDASVGQSVTSRGDIDVPVTSFGIFLGCMGKNHQHIILSQNSFHFTNGVYDVDYTAIPVSWTLRIRIVCKAEICVEDAQCLLNSFLRGRRRTLKRRTQNHFGS